MGVERAGGRLVVTVSDDGRGGAVARDGGVGLESMANRAEELGGGLEVTSGPSGTCVIATFPLRTAVAGERPE